MMKIVCIKKIIWNNNKEYVIAIATRTHKKKGLKILFIFNSPFQLDLGRSAARLKEIDPYPNDAVIVKAQQKRSVDPVVIEEIKKKI